MKIPDDITPILREIDQSLKEQQIPPPERPFNAVKEFGNRFHISLPLTKLPPGAPAELAANGVYTERIHRWYEEVYGDRIKSDFSAKAKIAVLADGDIWEMRIPLIVGTVAVQAKRELPSQTGNVIGKRVLDVNPCASLTGITKARLRHFSDGDLKEIYGLFVVGLDVRNAFDRFRKADPLFAAAEDDWATAVALMTSQTPNWGQARWASLQMTEKFVKGLITLIGGVSFKRNHDLMALHATLKVSAPDLNIEHLFAEIQCSAGVRYNDPKTPSTRQQAYAAHKASLLVVRVLGSVKYSQQR